MRILNLKLALLGVLSLLAIAIFMTSCGQNDLLGTTDQPTDLTIENPETPEKALQESTSFVERVQVYESANNVEYYPVTIGASQRIYKLQKQNPQSAAFFNLIKEAQTRTLNPVKISVDQTSGFVKSVASPTTEESRKWKETDAAQIHKEANLVGDEGVFEDIDQISDNRNSVVFSSYNDVASTHQSLGQYRCVYYGPQMPRCITFEYKADGCYARAHRMKEIMEYGSKTCYKIVVFADIYNGKALTVPGCNSYGWAYHLAPLVQAGGVWYVVDPSLSSTPLTRSQWYALMGTSNVCDVEYTLGDYYMPTGYGCGTHSYYTDPNYYHTYYTLANYERRFGC